MLYSYKKQNKKKETNKQTTQGSTRELSMMGISITLIGDNLTCVWLCPSSSNHIYLRCTAVLMYQSYVNKVAFKKDICSFHLSCQTYWQDAVTHFCNRDGRVSKRKSSEILLFMVRGSLVKEG